ncbi:MAG TPA: ABC transporter [Candidatus Avacidaminococcus intestinavium]|uniref:ABC transporter n=1 Tax=Candidatus Avacidaminococcus intestinavium TaxID=2840684 RepID=A0A9D1MQ17_9FIRM|nr:ABC transporter [Candidatus Avacidaminococcus intestinavium]
MVEQVALIEIEPAKDTHRWVAITALLLAIGIILHTISPNIGGVTPNWTIAMYSITISLTDPSFKQAAGIGFIAGLTLVPSSKSAFPLGNLVSDLTGALVAAMMVKSMVKIGLANFKFGPFFTGFLATMASGAVFTFILKLILSLPLSVYIYAMLPVVATVAVLNGFITQVLFAPAQKLFFMQGGRKK